MMSDRSHNPNIADARSIYEEAVRAVLPTADGFVDLAAPSERSDSGVSLIGVGKASAVMVQAACAAAAIKSSLLTIPYSYVTEDQVIDRLTRDGTNVAVVLGDHPYPGIRSREAVETTLTWIRQLEDQQPVAVLISGGGSALWGHPVEGISQKRYEDIVKALVDGGYNIGNVNLLRRHLNVLGGGGLRIALGRRQVMTFILSDVPGDDLSIVASGPMSLPSSSEVDELESFLVELEDSSVILPSESAIILKSALNKVRTYLPEGPFRLVGSNRTALEAARRSAELLGYTTRISKTPISGDAVRFGREVVAREASRISPGHCLLFGGESTVDVTGSGRGGRNQEMALSIALALERDQVDATVLVAGTDGVDGPTDAAGAIVDGSTVEHLAKAGRFARESLNNNDSYSFFEGTRHHLITGPTHTNVMDIVVVLT